MARSYGRIATSIWQDPDFRALTPAAKLAYLMLVTQANVSAAGVLDLTDGRWARSLGITRDQLDKVLTELCEHRYVVIDHDAEQLLIRTFVKWDGGVNNGQRREAIRTASRAVASPLIGSELAAQLDAMNVPHALSRPHGMPPHAVDNQGHRGPIEAPSDEPRVVVNEGDQRTNPQPATRNPDPQPATGSREPSPINGPRPPEHCPKHPGGTDQPCVPCKRARLATEAWDTAQPARRRAAATRRQAAITACTQCDPEGWLLALDGQPAIPAIRCTHTTETP